MKDSTLVHAVWAGALMYCCALACLTVVMIHRPAQTGEAVAAKLIALFGPVITLLSALAFRRGNGSSDKPQGG